MRSSLSEDVRAAATIQLHAMNDLWPRTILNVSHNNYLLGGSDKVFLEMGQLLKKRGHHVVPFCAKDSRNDPSEYSDYFPDSIDTRKPRMRDLGRFIYSTAAKNLVSELISAKQIDLAHLHIYYGKLTASILNPLKMRGIPIVQTLHEYKLICPVYTLTTRGAICEACKGQSFWHALSKKCNKGSVSRTLLSVAESYTSLWLGAIDQVDHFIGVSRFVTQKMIEHGVPKERITTIHNFIDADSYIPERKPGGYVLYFGRLESVKGVYTLLEAFAGISEVELLIVGTGSEQQKLGDWIERYRLTNVKMLGFMQGAKLHDLIRGAICSVVPSIWYEPFGLTVLESFALGVPVIVTNIGGLPELVADENDGLIVAPSNPDELKAAILKMIRNRIKAKQMGMEGRRKVVTCFNGDKYYENLRAVYNKAEDNLLHSSCAR